MNISTRIEGRRGCGYRKAGGLYLVDAGRGRYCGALPIPLSVCPTCHHGVKPARGWTWVDLQALRAGKPCVQQISPDYCDKCPFFGIGMTGLIWVGEKFYPTTGSFSSEARQMGISRRIAQIPRQFKLGETWVALAHRRAILEEVEFGKEPVFTPGIFHLFRPSAIEYVVSPEDSEKKLEGLEERGITLVKVIPREEQEAA